MKIASETAGNGAQRIGHQLARGIGRDGARDRRDAGRRLQGGPRHIEAAVINEKNTLETVNELAADKARVAAHVAALQKVDGPDRRRAVGGVDAHMKPARRG